MLNLIDANCCTVRPCFIIQTSLLSFCDGTCFKKTVIVKDLVVGSIRKLRYPVILLYYAAVLADWGDKS